MRRAKANIRDHYSAGDSLTISFPGANTSPAHFVSNDFEVWNMIIAEAWFAGLPAFISADSKRLHWANGFAWSRTSKCG